MSAAAVLRILARVENVRSENRVRDLSRGGAWVSRSGAYARFVPAGVEVVSRKHAGWVIGMSGEGSQATGRFYNRRQVTNLPHKALALIATMLLGPSLKADE